MLAAKYQDYMFDLIKKVIDEIGPRLPCSDAEKKLGHLLVDEWKPVCDKVDVEPFTCSPTAWVGLSYILALSYFAAVILYWFLPPLALAIATASCSILFLEVVRYREIIDSLFPRKQGENVIGAIRTRGEPAQRLIVGAHMDSGYVSTLFLYFGSVGWTLLAIAVLALVIALAACVAKTIAYFDVFSSDAALAGVGIAMAAISPVMGAFLFLNSRRPAPGAMDNMSGVAVVAGLGKYLGESRRSGDWAPQRTEVMLLATSTEEAGSRGAKRYVRRHLKEMKTIRTYFLNIDTIKNERFLTVWKVEPCNGARHDPELVMMAQEVAASHNWPIAVRRMSLMNDAVPFSMSRIPVAFLYSIDPSTVYPATHSMRDTYDHIRPESLSVVLQLVIDMIQRIDKS